MTRSKFVSKVLASDGWSNGATRSLGVQFANTKDLYEEAMKALKAGGDAKVLKKIASSRKLMAGDSVNWQEIADYLLGE